VGEQKKEKKRLPVRRWRLVLAVSVLLLVYTLSGFFLLPWILQTQAEKRLPGLLQRPVTVARVQFNPFTLQLKINKFIFLILSNILCYNYIIRNTNISKN